MKIAFVTFHVDLGAQEAESVLPVGGRFLDIYHEMLYLLMSSARAYHPECRCVVLTDQHSQIPSVVEGLEVVRSRISADTLMRDRIVSQHDYLAGHTDDENVVLLDSDILLNATVCGAFEVEFDVGVTFRGRTGQAINGGVIFVSSRGRTGAITFFGRLIQAASAYDESLGWYCDQEALMDVVGREAFAHRTSDVLNCGGVPVRFFPHDVWNWTPETNSEIFRPLAAPRLLHFKGKAKSLMRPYWDAHGPRMRDEAVSSIIRRRMQGRAAILSLSGREKLRHLRRSARALIAPSGREQHSSEASG